MSSTPPPSSPIPAAGGFGHADATESSRANRLWWDFDADNYHREHSRFLGADQPEGKFLWSPEYFDEADHHLLGDVRDKDVLEFGCGSAPCSRWLNHTGVGTITAFDISAGMLRHGVDASTGTPVVPLVQADALAMPFKDNCFDVAFTAYGAIGFVADSQQLMHEAARVLRPGGRLVFSVLHPFRWVFRDEPGEEGLIAYLSYFDRSPYIERDPVTRTITYAEHHRTIGDRIRELLAAGFILDDFIEPEWPDNLEESFNQFSPTRGRIIPGTAIIVAHLPD
ncbi:class I SAM-dependent methyltransferase [Corynebacterium mendelii]|uniref:class I SAM-dependent methyltransferase n=1 Tax=Corynebacterium mendelii TaxID=2765362 RepID=UPI002ED45916